MPRIFSLRTRIRKILPKSRRAPGFAPQARGEGARGRGPGLALQRDNLAGDISGAKRLKRILHGRRASRGGNRRRRRARFGGATVRFTRSPACVHDPRRAAGHRRACGCGAPCAVSVAGRPSDRLSARELSCSRSVLRPQRVRARPCLWAALRGGDDGLAFHDVAAGAALSALSPRVCALVRRGARAPLRRQGRLWRIQRRLRLRAHVPALAVQRRRSVSDESSGMVAVLRTRRQSRVRADRVAHDDAPRRGAYPRRGGAVADGGDAGLVRLRNRQRSARRRACLALVLRRADAGFFLVLCRRADPAAARATAACVRDAALAGRVRPMPRARLGARQGIWARVRFRGGDDRVSGDRLSRRHGANRNGPRALDAG